MVMDPSLELFKETPAKYYINSRSISRRSMVSLTIKDKLFLGRGGQSALRFARLRVEKRHNYVRKVAETAVEMFIRNDKVGYFT